MMAMWGRWGALWNRYEQKRPLSMMILYKILGLQINGTSPRKAMFPDGWASQ